MSGLAELQGALQRAILENDDAVLAALAPGGRESREVLLGVYRNAYWARLAGIIGNDHEMLAAYMGEQPFAELARAYAEACPSAEPNARWVTRRLPDFIAATPPYANYRQLADLAELERALNDAFDSADGETVGVEALAAIAPEQWQFLCFQFHPSARRLDLASNAVAIWQALKDEEDPPTARLCDPAEAVLVWRSELTSRLRLLEPEEAAVWGQAAAGVAFGALCELLAERGDPDGAAARAAGYVQAWFSAGLVASVGTCS